jgi:hypothetical protein
LREPTRRPITFSVVVRSRTVLLSYAAIAVSAALLAVALEPASQGARLAVALAAIAALVLSYVSIGAAALRAYRDEAAGPSQRRSLAHLLIVAGTPLVVFAAHPWGIASVAVGFGVLAVCQVVFLHVTLVVAFALKRRARQASTR